MSTLLSKPSKPNEKQIEVQADAYNWITPSNPLGFLTPRLGRKPRPYSRSAAESLLPLADQMASDAEVAVEAELSAYPPRF